MSESGVRIVNWNVEWKHSHSQAARILRERIFETDPDIVCLTEGYADFFGGPGHVIEADADYGYPIHEGRRKVLLWSRHSWTNVDRIGSAELPGGRFVRGTTTTPIGDMDVIGVCIPWSAAHVTSGRRDRQRWEDHLAYLRGLACLLPRGAARLVLLGDFNQKVPRTTAPMTVYQALEDALLSRLALATAGPIAPLGEQLIDHVAHSRDLISTKVQAISNRTERSRLSDHLGVAVSLEPQSHME